MSNPGKRRSKAEISYRLNLDFALINRRKIEINQAISKKILERFKSGLPYQARGRLSLTRKWVNRLDKADFCRNKNDLVFAESFLYGSELCKMDNTLSEIYFDYFAYSMGHVLEQIGGARVSLHSCVRRALALCMVLKISPWNSVIQKPRSVSIIKPGEEE